MSLNQSMTQLITSVTTIIGVLFMMLSINVWMTLAALLILPVSMVIINFVMKHSQKYFRDRRIIWERSTDRSRKTTADIM